MKRSQIQLISAMLIFGSLGLFVRQLTLSSALIAFFRAAIGGCFFFLIINFPFHNDITPLLNAYTYL